MLKLFNTLKWYITKYENSFQYRIVIHVMGAMRSPESFRTFRNIFDNSIRADKARKNCANKRWPRNMLNEKILLELSFWCILDQEAKFYLSAAIVSMNGRSFEITNRDLYPLRHILRSSRRLEAQLKPQLRISPDTQS